MEVDAVHELVLSYKLCPVNDFSMLAWLENEVTRIAQMTVVLGCLRRLVFRSFGAGSCEYLCGGGGLTQRFLVRLRGGNFGQFIELSEE